MSNYRRTTLATAVLAATLAPLSGVVLAQSPMLEEVIVTATKRAEGMQDVPIAISVVSGDRIEQQGVRNLEELSLYLPAVHIAQSGGQNQVFIRGIGSGNNTGFEQSVGTFVDGVYFGRARNSQAAFLDLQRVEVLKGPQSTLFGKNTVAGAINITTQRPTDEFEGYVEGSYNTETEGYTTTAVVSGPLTDTLRGRLVGKYYDEEGYYENTDPAGEDPTREDKVVRTWLDWDATDNLTFSLKAEYGEFNKEGNLSKIVKSTPTADFLFGFVPDDNFAKSVGFNEKQSSSNRPGKDIEDETDNTIVQLDFVYQMENHSLKSISAWTEYDTDLCTDGDYATTQFADQCKTEDHEQFTQEFILSSELGGKFNYMVGLYYQDADLKATTNTGFLPSAIPPLEAGILNLLESALGFRPPSGFSDSEVFSDFDQETTTWSVFTQVDYDITDRLRLRAGIRYSDDNKDVENHQFITNIGCTEPKPINTFLLSPDVFNLRVPYDYELKRGEDHTTGSVNLQYDIGDDIMVYATWANGYKAGGFDESNGLDIAREFEDESVDHYEIGAKMELWDNRVRLNLSGFHTSFDDLQVSTWETATFIVTNAGEATTDGIEADFTIAATEDLTVYGALTWLDAEYDTYDDAACTVEQQIAGGLAPGCRQDLEGTPLQFAPDWSGNIGFTYDWGVTANTNLVFNADAFYSDEILIAPDNDPVGIQDSYWKINARIAWEANDGQWMVAVLGKNLNDETTFNWLNDATLAGQGFGFERAYFGQVEIGRSYEVQLRYSF
jgi:outer membrane receptor protein involved in Fe transport